MSINIMRWRNFYFAISLAVILPGLFFLARFGLRPAVDFTGGSLLEVVFLQPIPLNSEIVRTVIGDVYDFESFQPSGENQYLFRGKPLDNDHKNQVLALLQKSFSPVQELRFETIGPVLGRELLKKMILALVLVSIIITLYIWKQFSELKYGVCAILAMLHDTLVVLGVFSMLGYFLGVEVDVLFVTALLTTLSFSVHDTIVVYDRIRELKRKHAGVSYLTLVNTAVIETLGRSLNNSITIIIMLLSLALLGGETIRWFAVALLVGAVTGTYSSTFTAAPLLLLWDDFKKWRKR